jgi:hypothetical protein
MHFENTERLGTEIEMIYGYTVFGNACRNRRRKKNEER